MPLRVFSFGGTLSIIATVTPSLIERTWVEIDYHLYMCRATEDAHILASKFQFKSLLQGNV